MCIHVYGYELIIGMYMVLCIYPFVHIGAKTYLHGYVERKRESVSMCDYIFYVGTTNSALPV